MLENPPFEVFFSAMHRGHRPLPWQERLAREVSASGWPAAPIGIPTGLGKTACLDIAVWALARQASLRPVERTLPTRIWYVVNRRLLVDAAAAHGAKMCRLLGHPEQLGDEDPEARWDASPEHVSSLEAIGAALESMTVPRLDEPLHMARLRGGADLGARPRDPSQPCLVFATVPMFASRWLFRGYGTSTSMRPVDAALAGIDTLVLLDEAHLAAPLAGLGAPLAACDPGDPTRVLPVSRCRPQFVSMTATSGTEGSFDLGPDDLDDPLVRRRLYADKPTSLVETTKKDLVNEMARQAISLLAEPSRRTCLVFVNTASLARQVHARLMGAGRKVLLVTGRARDREADAIRQHLLDPYRGVPAGRPSDASRAPLWIVATQTLEVGADIDVDSLVTQSAGVRALVQRFGRLNRFGGPDRNAAAVVCHATDMDDPVYGGEPSIAWERLRLAGSGVSLSPAVIGSVLGDPADQLDRGCEPLPALVWEWVKTSLPPVGEAPPEAYFSRLDDDVARVSVCWRATCPPPGVPLIPSVTAAESVELPIGELRQAFTERGEATVTRLCDDKVTVVPDTPLGRLRPGDVVILDAARGLYDEFGWNAAETRMVADVSLLDAGILPLRNQAIENLVEPGEVVRLNELVKELYKADADGGQNADFDRQWASQIIGVLREENPRWMTKTEWARYCDLIGNKIARPEGDPARYLLAKPQNWSSHQDDPLRADVFDELSFDAFSSTELAAHLEGVGEVAERMAERLGMPELLCAAVGRAARWHDIGKADLRFQRWLDPQGGATTLMAKSKLGPREIEAARVDSGWPKGGRHEALSSRLVQAWVEQDGYLEELDDQLVVHLVASHHGHGRPSFPVVSDPSAGPMVAELDGRAVRVEADLSDPDWSQPLRFRRLCERYGYWGLALLETVVRLADHLVSKGVAA